MKDLLVYVLSVMSRELEESGMNNQEIIDLLLRTEEEVGKILSQKKED